MRTVIVGAGLGGLAAGIALKQTGHEVVVLERARERSEVKTGITLWPFAIEALAALGLGRDVVAKVGAPFDRLVNLASDGRRLSEVDLSSAPGAPKAYDIDRTALQTALLQELGLEHVRYEARCVAVEETTAKVSALIDGGEEVEGDVLVGADGVHSIVRQHLAPDAVAASPDMGAWRGTVEADETMVAANAHIRIYGPGGVFGAARLDERRVRFYAGGPMRIDPPPRPSQLADRFGGWGEPAASLIAASDPETLLFNDTPRIPRLSGWARGRIALLGDAAHAAVPTLGASGGVALVDAVSLGHALTSERDPGRALAVYARVREPIGHRVQWEAELFGRLEMSTRRRLLRLRDHVFGQPFAALQSRAMQHLASGFERPFLADLIRSTAPALEEKQERIGATS